MKKEDEAAMVDRLAKRATDPMDTLMKKQQSLNQEMLKYSFELGRKLGYIHGYAEAKDNKPMDLNCTPEALAEFFERKIQ